MIGVKLGIYTSKSQWVPIFGSYSGGSGYPLWYANYISSPRLFLLLFLLFFIFSPLFSFPFLLCFSLTTLTTDKNLLPTSHPSMAGPNLLSRYIKLFYYYFFPSFFFPLPSFTLLFFSSSPLACNRFFINTSHSNTKAQ